jgi:hypothetical protein
VTSYILGAALLCGGSLLVSVAYVFGLGRAVQAEGQIAQCFYFALTLVGIFAALVLAASGLGMVMG